MIRVKYNDLKEFTSQVLAHAGLDEYSKEAVTTGLCESSLRGVDSHGIRLLPHYVNSALSGRKNTKPNFKFSNKFPAIAYLDADHAFGHAAGFKAIDEAMKIAAQFGVAIVGVGNSSHSGAMASFALRAARQGYAAMAFTHADALQISYNGTRSYFGTNPFCFACPRENEEPFCLDMATSTIPWNRVLQARNSGTKLAPNTAADINGNMTEDPNQAKSLISAGGYKGFGLAAMIDILCGPFTGMAFGHDIPAMFTTPIELQRKIGQFYLVFRVDGCVSQNEFIHNLKTMSDELRAEPPMPGSKVMMANDKEIQESKIRLLEGIPLPENVANDLMQLKEKYSIQGNFFI